MLELPHLSIACLLVSVCELLNSWEWGQGFGAAHLLKKSLSFFLLPRASTGTGKREAGWWSRLPFPRVTADRPFTNIPADMIAGDTNNAAHILSATANNALGIIPVNTHNYC